MVIFNSYVSHCQRVTRFKQKNLGFMGFFHEDNGHILKHVTVGISYLDW